MSKQTNKQSKDRREIQKREARRYGEETVIPKTVTCFNGVHAMVTCRDAR